jgi:hypothetical protein
VIRFTLRPLYSQANSPLYAMSRRQSWTQRLSECQEEEIPLPLLGFETRIVETVALVTIAPALRRLQCSTDTGDGQNNGNSCEIFLLIWSSVIIYLHTTCILLGTDSYKFWIVSSALLYRSSWGTSSSCVRDEEGENLLLTVLSETGHSVSMIYKPGECAGQESCRSESSCSSN